MFDFKNLLTTIVSILLLAVEPINAWLLSNQPFNWKTFASTVLMAIVAYATGKNANMTPKSETQLTIQKEQKEA